VAMMQVRSLGRIGEPEWLTVLLFSCFVCLTGGVGLAVDGWPTIGLEGWMTLIGVGMFGLVGQLALTRAFGLGSALLTAALQYTTIVFAAVLAAVLWDDMPDWMAWCGMALIIASGLLSTWRTYSETRIMQGQTVATATTSADSPESGRRVCWAVVCGNRACRQTQSGAQCVAHHASIPFVEVLHAVFHGRLVRAHFIASSHHQGSPAGVHTFSDLIVFDRRFHVGGLLGLDEFALEGRYVF